MNKKNFKKNILPYVLIIGFMLVIFYVFNIMNNNVKDLTYNELMQNNFNEEKKNQMKENFSTSFSKKNLDIYIILRLNYPTDSDPNGREYKWKETGTWKTYDPQGILF